MAFRYKLESILRLRRSIERQEEQRLLAMAATVAQLKAEIAYLGEAQFGQKRELIKELEAGTSGAVLQFVLAGDAAMEERRRALVRTLKECEAKRVEQLAVYEKARQKREILSGLRERQQAAYEREVSRRSQQNADEVFLYRRFFATED